MTPRFPAFEPPYLFPALTPAVAIMHDIEDDIPQQQQPDQDDARVKPGGTKKLAELLPRREQVAAFHALSRHQLHFSYLLIDVQIQFHLAENLVLFHRRGQGLLVFGHNTDNLGRIHARGNDGGKIADRHHGHRIGVPGQIHVNPANRLVFLQQGLIGEILKSPIQQAGYIAVMHAGLAVVSGSRGAERHRHVFVPRLRSHRYERISVVRVAGAAVHHIGVVIRRHRAEQFIGGRPASGRAVADRRDRILRKLHHIPPRRIIGRIPGDDHGVAGGHILIGIVQPGDVGEMGTGAAQFRREFVHPRDKGGFAARYGHGHGQGGVGSRRHHGGGEQIPQRPGLPERHVAVSQPGARNGGVEHLQRVLPLNGVEVEGLFLDRLHGVGAHHHPHQCAGGIRGVRLFFIQDDIVRRGHAQIHEHGGGGFHPVAFGFRIGIKHLCGGGNRQNPRPYGQTGEKRRESDFLHRHSPNF